MNFSIQLWFVLPVTLGLVALGVRAADWPQWLGPQRNAVWQEDGILKEFPSGGLRKRWSTPIGGGYSGPAIANGRVYVTDRLLAPGVQNSTNQFERSSARGVERVLCLNETTGQVLWQYEYECPYTVSYPAGPRTTPVVDHGKVYTLGTEGNLLCLDAVTGKIVWERNFKTDFHVASPIWGFAANPLLDGNKLICLVGGAGTGVVAFDKETGHELWRALSAKEPGYSSPIIIQAGGQRQLIVWSPEENEAGDLIIAKLDPQGYHEISRTHLLEPTNTAAGRKVVWSHPAYADRCIFARNDHEIICVSLAAH